MKWTILYYGLAIALLVLLIKSADYNLFSRHISFEVYTGILVLIFTSIGLWFGLRITNPKVIVQTRIVEAIDANQLKSHGISEREFEILNLIIEGHTNQQIADKLFISLSTVKSHLQNTYQKLDVSNRTQAIHKAKSLSAQSST